MKIDATKNSPRVELNPDGDMIIKGRSILDDPFPFYNNIIDWINKCTSEKLNLEIRIEYMNTSSSKLILYLLKSIKEHFNNSKVYIKWYYDSDDEDMLDMGKDFESIIRIPIDFYELQVEEA
ncbi:MAG: DUF1987 domain-containing protein [Methanobacterium sp.]